MVQEAEGGQFYRIQSLYDEMISRDSTLKALLDLQSDYLAAASFSVLPWPESYRRGLLASTEEAKRARTISDYIFGELFRPEVRLGNVVRDLWGAYVRGYAGIEVVVAPGEGPLVEGRKTERLVSMRGVPPQRFRYNNMETALQIDQKGDQSKYVNVDSLGSSLFMLEADIAFPNRARRGLMRPLMSLWLIRNLGMGWWSRFVELYGVPFRLGKFPEGNVRAEKAIRSLLQFSGASGFAAIPDTASIEIVDTFQRISGHSPHQAIAEYGSREYAKLIAGHGNAIETMAGAGGSGEATKHADSIFVRKTNARGAGIASAIRTGYVMPAVARNFSVDDALLYTPSVGLFVEQLSDLVDVTNAFSTAVSMGIETIPVDEFHNATGIRRAQPGEDCIRAIPAPGQPTKDAVQGKPPASRGAKGADGAPADSSSPPDPAGTDQANVSDPQQENP